jgi:hypothetical protein
MTIYDPSLEYERQHAPEVRGKFDEKLTHPASRTASRPGWETHTQVVPSCNHPRRGTCPPACSLPVPPSQTRPFTRGDRTEGYFLERSNLHARSVI